MTVLGPVDPADLGVVLPHEHLLTDVTTYFTAPDDPEARRFAETEPVGLQTLHLLRRNLFALRDNLLVTDLETAVVEASRFRALGGGTIVDVTLPDIGRDPAGLREIARRTGLHVVMGCGHYVWPAHPASLAAEPLESIEERLVAEIEHGVGDTGVRPGIIGEIGTWAPIHPVEEKVLRAAARAQRRTGLALSIHLHVTARAGHSVLDLLEEEGVDPARVVLGHLDICFGHLDATTAEVLDYHLSLARRGPFLEYDTLGTEAVYNPGGGDVPPFWTPWDRTRAEGVAHLFAHGFGGQVVLSHDVFTKAQLVAYGGSGYGHLLRDFTTHLRTAGLGDAEIRQVLVENPRRLLVPA